MNKDWFRHVGVIAVTALCVISVSPVNGMAQEVMQTRVIQKFLDQVQDPTEEGINACFADLATLLVDSEDPIADAYYILQGFVDQMNVSYGCALSVSQLLRELRSNQALFQGAELDMTEFARMIDALEEYGASEERAVEIEMNSAGRRHHHHKKKKGKGKGLWIIAIIAGSAVILGIVNPASIPVIIDGAVTVGRLALEKNKK
ncbi:MAG: hypothetical protein HY861_00135 [Chlamydiia bacterium]|nr:hypothetical protein [Chlamydiia bacterium]